MSAPTLLRDNPLLLLFVITALGQVFSRIQFHGFGLGISSVLFVGLAFGAWDSSLKIPDFVVVFGLSLFVYTMGLSSGPGFFRSFQHKGWRANLAVLGILLVMGACAVLMGHALGWNEARITGLLSGSFTNTPALASILDTLRTEGATTERLEAPVVAYSLAYPSGVLGMLLAVFFAKRWMKEANAQNDQEAVLESWVVRITQPQAARLCLQDLQKAQGWNVTFARLKRDNQLMTATGQTKLNLGDLISLVGNRASLRMTTDFLGEKTDERLDLDRSAVDFRRIFVSNRFATEKALASLELESRFGAVVTRIRRGDVDLIPQAKTMLEPGDRVRVVAPRDRLNEVSDWLGDSYRSLSEIDVLTFSVGIALGLLLGVVPWPLPGGRTFELGFAGGPLLVGLILGRLGRSGPWVWTLPYSANLTLRQLGLLLFLAGVGLRSGLAFAQTLQNGDDVLPMMLGGAGLTLVGAGLALAVGHWILRLPFAPLAGFLAGLQTQPAVLGYAVERSGNDQPNVTYALVYPLAMISKIILVQILLSL